MNKLIFRLFLSFCIISFLASCEDDDDDNDTPTTSTTTTPTTGPGSGSGGGTGGGTGSMGIPPNSMKATINDTLITFNMIIGLKSGNDISITGTNSNASFPSLVIVMADSIAKGGYTYPLANGEPQITYNKNGSKIYTVSNGQFRLITIDTAQKLVNGRFDVVMKNIVDPGDSIFVTQGEFNRFYN